MACWKRSIRSFSASLTWLVPTTASAHLLLPCPFNSASASPSFFLSTILPRRREGAAPPRRQDRLTLLPPRRYSPLPPTPLLCLLQCSTGSRGTVVAVRPWTRPAGGLQPMEFAMEACSRSGKVPAFRVHHGWRSAPSSRRPLRARLAAWPRLPSESAMAGSPWTSFEVRHGLLLQLTASKLSSVVWTWMRA